jgi:hypothetical protein
MHGRLACAALVALLSLVVATSPAHAQSDAFDAATPLYLGAPVAADNTGATTQPGEALTARGPLGLTHCVNGTTTSQAGRTLWWVLGGTGRPITITTAGSVVDTHLGIFEGPLSAGALCQDAGGTGESVTFPSVAGRPYRVQVGACVSNSAGGCGAATGAVRLLATSPPPANDLRAAAAALPPGTAVGGDNYAAGEDPGEPVTCRGRGLGRTVWYRFTAPSYGSLRVVVTGADPTVALYPQSGPMLGCDATLGRDARVELRKVAKGDVLVQVGGLGAHAPPAGDSAQSLFTVRAEFKPGPDRDGDGVPNGRDCRPDDARVHRDAEDVPRNGIDEDCNGRDAFLDRVKARAQLGVDVRARYTRIRSLRARDVPAGARVQLRCSGRACPFKRTRARTVRRKRGSVSLMTAALRSARIVPRTTLDVHVTRSGRIGSVTRFRFDRRGREPVEQIRCLPPGSRTPTRC